MEVDGHLISPSGGITAAARGIPRRYRLAPGRTLTRTRTSSVGFDHLFRMLARRVGEFGPTQHAGHLFRAFVAGDRSDAGPRTPRGLLLLDQVVLVAESSNLGQVGNA